MIPPSLPERAGRNLKRAPRGEDPRILKRAPPHEGTRVERPASGAF